ncbi:hypothetical protein WMY93_022643 [Mugilogobius chulae]|uniref:Uncharacterized protein n=1 Tax=Mugilogobius chulae TaxID=88201 RepID=A0AAW0N7I7_9GOBI
MSANGQKMSHCTSGETLRCKTQTRTWRQTRRHQCQQRHPTKKNQSLCKVRIFVKTSWSKKGETFWKQSRDCRISSHRICTASQKIRRDINPNGARTEPNVDKIDRGRQRSRIHASKGSRERRRNPKARRRWLRERRRTRMRERIRARRVQQRARQTLIRRMSSRRQERRRARMRAAEPEE